MNSATSTNKEFTVLAYHGVHDVRNFENQLIFLKSKYNFLSIKDVENFAYNKKECSGKNVLISFDDGDASLYKNALPLLKKHGIPAIVFVVTDLINSDKPFWWDELPYYLGKNEGNAKIREVKSWSNKEREKYLEDLRVVSKKSKLKYKQLTTQELMEMEQAGICIANHSHSHPIFDQCEEKELDEELVMSTSYLTSLGFTAEAFAYPNGNFSENTERKLEEHGIKLAFLFDHKICKGCTNPLRISRLVVNDSTPLWKFKFILSGWHSRILPITKALGKLGI